MIFHLQCYVWKKGLRAHSPTMSADFLSMKGLIVCRIMHMKDQKGSCFHRQRMTHTMHEQNSAVPLFKSGGGGGGGCMAFHSVISRTWLAFCCSPTTGKWPYTWLLLPLLPLTCFLAISAPARNEEPLLSRSLFGMGSRHGFEGTLGTAQSGRRRVCLRLPTLAHATCSHLFIYSRAY